MGAITMLNERGDTTICWSSDRDDEMERIIQAKMDAGCTFFLIDPRFGTREPLRNVADANKARMLAIPDEDFAAFVGGGAPGSAVTVMTPAKPAKIRRKATSAKEVVKGEAVGLRPRAGG